MKLKSVPSYLLKAKAFEASVPQHCVKSPLGHLHKNMVNEMGGKTATYDEDTITDFPIGPVRLLKMLQQRHERAISYPGHCDAINRAIKIESPAMDEDFILSAVYGMKTTSTWEQCGEWSHLVKTRLGRV